MIKKFLAGLLSVALGFTIAACAKQKRITPIPDYNPNALVTIHEVDDIVFEEHEYSPVEIDNPDLMCNTFMDVDPDYKVTLQLTSSLLNATALENDVIVEDVLGNNVELDFNYQNNALSNANTVLLDVTPKELYQAGRAYSFSIENNKSLLFLGKDPSVRKIIFTIKDDDSSIMDLNTNYPTYDLNKVSNFSGFGEHDTFLYYDGQIDCKKDDILLFTEGEEKLFVQVVKVESDNGELKIHYKCPEVKDFVNDLDLHINQHEVDVAKDFTLNNIEDIVHDVTHSEQTLMYCYAIADKYDFVPQLGGFLESANVNFSFKPEGTKFTLSLDLSYTTTTRTGWRICASFKFRWVKSFIISADAKVETFLGIPYDISMNAAVASDFIFTFQPTITKKHKAINIKNVEDTPKDLDLNRAKEAVEEFKDRWVDLDKTGYKKDLVVGDTIMINLGHLGIHLGYLTIDIDVYACFKMTTDITLGASYTYSCHEVLIEYGSGSGDPDGGDSPSDISVNTISAYICGKISIEAYLKVRVTIYITGLKHLANLMLDGDIGVYFEISGLGTLGYDFNTMSLDGELGASIEFGFLIRVSLSVNLLWVVHLNWDLLTFKFPIFKLGFNYAIQDKTDVGVINLNKLETDIGETGLLTFNIFDADGLCIITKTFGYKDEVTYYESILSKDAKYRIFTDIEAKSDKVKIENGYIKVDPNVAELDFDIDIYVKKNPVTNPVKYTVRCHYVSSEAKYISFDGQNQVAYLPGNKIEFPKEVEERPGYLFKGWIYNGKLYNDRSDIVVLDDNINFEALYVLDEIYTVKFYDGFNNLIYTTTVKNYDDVVAPEDAIRDKNMEGYTFVGYDKSLKEIKGDLEIHAIYVKNEGSDN